MGNIRKGGIRSHSTAAWLHAMVFRSWKAGGIVLLSLLSVVALAQVSSSQGVEGPDAEAALAGEIEPPTGTITATPPVCNIPPGGTVCSSTIDWWANKPTPNVWVTPLDNSNPQLFASGSTRQQVAPWITAAGHRFHLKTTGGVLMATVVARGNLAPNITLTAPTAGASYLAPTSIQIAANASDPDGSVQRVEFWADGQLLVTQTSSPYQTTWNNVTVGNHQVQAVAYDNLGHSRASSLIAVTVRPSDVIGHIDGLGRAGNGEFRILGWACSTELNQSIDVHLYAGGGWPAGAFISGRSANDSSEAGVATACQAQGSAYRFSIPLSTSVRQQHGGKGIYIHGISPVGRANNLLTQSGAFAIPGMPVVTLTSPVAGTVINGPASYLLSADASVSNATITKVDFYNGTTLIGTDVSAPYNATWSNIPPGTYSITAKAYDDAGAVSTSAATSFTVNAVPTVSITAPTSGAVVTAPASVLIQAAASDVDDAVAMVEFYVDGQWRATDIAAPFALQADNLPKGTYTLVAKAYDNRGGATTSAPVTLIVNERPQVQLVSPANNAGVLVGTAITLAANATDSDGTISRVEFYDGATSLGTVSTPPYQLPWTATQAGDHSLVAKAYDNRGAVTTSAANLLRVRLNGFELIQDGQSVSLGGELPTHDPAVGALAGSSGVSGGGSTYEIPIAVPPGRRGMAPQLALNYSSRAGNGIAGMGWSLSGLSSIQRCPATLDQDAQVRAVRLDAYDRLCLDGQRLLVKSGAYGQTGATYGTEVESFVRVTQLGGGLDSASSYFKVERKSGEISYYGNGVNGRVIPGGKSVPLTWLVNRTEDRVGNFVEYRYASFAEGEVLISSVLYTGFGNTAGDRKVEFAYETRSDVEHSSAYLAGGLTRQTQRLRFIRTYVGLGSVREYRLRYDLASSHTGRSLLRGVADCAYLNGNAICRAETTFAWQEAAGLHPFRSLGLTGLPDPEKLANIHEVGDLDGDGIQELSASYRTGDAPYPRVSYYFSVNADRQVRGLIAASELDGHGAVGNELSDFNHDGRTDFLTSQDVGGATQLAVGVWNSTTTQFVPSGFTVYALGIAAGCTARVADFNGDGYSDVLVTVSEDGLGCGGYDATRERLRIYLGKVGSSPGVPAVSTTPAIDVALPAVTNIIVGELPLSVASYSVERLDDFDGDGLPDVFLTRVTDRTERNKPQLVWFGRVGSNGAYSLGGVGNEITSFAALASPQLAPDETHVSALNQWVDVNGDGLTDFLSAIRQADGNGYWTVRLNQGGILGPRIVTTSRRGIEKCVSTSTNYLSANCADRWHPMFLSQLSTGDTNSDGQVEMLVPRGFAARICGAVNGTKPNGEPKTDYYCPEHPVTGEMGPYPSDFTPTEDYMKTTYGDGGNSLFQGRFDASAYFMDALRFVQTGTGFRVEVISTPIVKGGDQRAMDLYGDGLQDQVSFLGCPWKPLAQGGHTYCYAFTWPADPTWGPSSLPNGAGGVSALVGSRKPFVSENIGAGARTGMPPLLPDYLAQATDGLGNQTLWDYAPLSSRAGRGATDTPLYSLPADPASRYVDNRHVYFASSMPVVAEMIRSDGAGDYRSLRYGYTEAMYHMRGRGFQGFRSIIEEDEAAGLRTTSTFHQKFPLTSQLESVIVNPIVRPGTSGAIKSEQYVWRCNRADRNDTEACIAATGGTTVFPYLDRKETGTFDVAVASNPSGGTPPAIGYVQEVNADDATCTGNFASNSGFDAYGNLTARTVHVADGTGAGGLRVFVEDQCQREQASYTVDTGNWWLDRLDQRIVTSSIRWDATQHLLPINTANPAQTVVTQYTWNADRTPATEIVQPGIANQQRATAYVYPSGTNHGLPTGVGISADGDPNGTRSSGTAYSADGYFPRVLTNALEHAAVTEVRARDGQPYLSTDANGLRTFAQYDAFGTLIRNQYRGRTDAEYIAPDKNIAITACNGGCGGLAVYAITEVQDGAPTKVSYLDGFGRPVRVTTRLADGALSQVSTAYNARGQVEQQSEPYKIGETPSWTMFAYDLIGRATSKLSPQANHDNRGNRATTYTYSGRQIQIRVCGTADSGTGNCLTLSRTTDSLGRYVETVDAKGGRTRFWYNPSGSALALEDAKGTVIRAGYNALGHRTTVDDPNQGAWAFTYNALGELKQQTDARQVTTNFAYDKLGRPTSRTASVDVTGDGVADAVADGWTYDPLNARGQPATTQRTINGAVERATTVTYDGLIRPAQTDVTQALTSGSQSYQLRQKYDAYYGRPVGQEFPNGEAVEFLYSAYGHLLSERDPATGAEYRATTAMDARGNVMGERFADGNITGTRQYVAQTGQLALVQYSNFGGTSLRKLEYRYDVYGNLVSQSLNNGSSAESYRYDELHRLVEATRTGVVSGINTYGYDAAGNFTFKSDFSTTAANAYSYTGGSCGGGPNAVKAVQTASGTRTYCFDANGNLTADSVGLSVKYDHQNLPVAVQRGALRDDFRYGPDGQRTRSWGSDGARVYLSGYEHRTDTGETKVYLGDYAVISRSGGTRKVEYLLKDRLGSVDAVADASGTVTETRGYDAFGKPRSGTWADLSPAKLQNTATTPKGFTQHEHLNQLELIHMNGRVYDYNLGRFTGIDPFIQAPLNSQSLNPYSYILNNPLSGTDPTGYQSCGEEGKTGGASSVGGGTCDVPDRDRDDESIKAKCPGCDVRVVYQAADVGSPKKGDNGAKGQGATGGGTLQDRNGSMDQKGSGANNANGAVGGLAQAQGTAGNNVDEGNKTTVTASNSVDQLNIYQSYLDIPEYLRPPQNKLQDKAISSALAGLKLADGGEWVGYAVWRGPGYATSTPVWVPYKPVGDALVVTFPDPVPQDAVAIFHSHPVTGLPAADKIQIRFGPGDYKSLYDDNAVRANYLRGPDDSVWALRRQFGLPFYERVKRGHKL